jgi:SAM-dependent methyltransferase
MIGLDHKRYDTPIEPGDNARSVAISMAGRDHSILEIGTSTGYMSRALKGMGNTVVGVEKDPVAGEQARSYCDSLITGDIEALDLDASISSYDVIVIADVLEHLVDPWKVLKGLRNHIIKGGYVVVSMPNACHGDVLLSMMSGDFRYAPTGLLDITHVRFFAYRNIVELFHDCGYSIDDMHMITRPVGTTECAVSPAPEGLAHFIESLPYADVYQFVFKAFPCEGADNLPAQDVPLERVYEKSIGERVKYYEDRAARLEGELDAIRQSLGWKLLARCSDIFERLLPEGTWRRRAYSRLRDSYLARKAREPHR